MTAPDAGPAPARWTMPVAAPDGEQPVTTPIATSDVSLVHAVLGGSESAWRELIERYGGLIWAVIRRYLYSGDREVIRTVFVNTLESLYRRKLATYQGRSSLATWIAVVTRTEVLDHLRGRHGRRYEPSGLSRLAPLEQAIFRWFYVEGLNLSETVRRGTALDPGFTKWKLVDALRRIENAIDGRTLRRVADDLHAQSTGAASARMLAYLDHVRDEFRHQEATQSADYLLMEREARRVADRVQTLIAELPAAEREALTLRFERGWSARRIAEELGLEDARSAYTLLERVLRALRRRLRAVDPAPQHEEGP